MRATLPLFAILATPICEIATFILVGQRIGVWSTLGLVLLSAFVGVAILRRQGLGALTSINRGLRRKKPAFEGIADGFLLVVAAVLFIIPGFLTDLIGLILLLPPVRRWIWLRWADKIKMQTFYTSSYREAGRPDEAGKGDGFVDLSPEDYRRSQTHPGRDPNRIGRPD